MNVNMNMNTNLNMSLHVMPKPLPLSLFLCSTTYDLLFASCAVNRGRMCRRRRTLIVLQALSTCATQACQDPFDVHGSAQHMHLNIYSLLQSQTYQACRGVLLCGFDLGSYLGASFDHTIVSVR